MTITTTKSWKNYITLCRVMEKNDIEYECDDRELTVKCSVPGHEIEQNFTFEINPSKMLITLYSPLPLELAEERSADMSIGICMINNELADGSFCIDFKSRLIYFKLTSSFYESDVCGTVFEYLLSTAANVIDEYYPKLVRLSESSNTEPSAFQFGVLTAAAVTQQQKF